MKRQQQHMPRRDCERNRRASGRVSAAGGRGFSIVTVAIAGLTTSLLTSAAAAVEPDVLRFPLSHGPWILESPARPNHHVEALGEQAGIWGSVAHGFEGWVYPFKLFDGWSLFVSRQDEPPTDLQSLATRQIAAPHFAQLEYSGTDWRLATTWFVPRTLPGALLLLD
jgi:hypothetical protein